MANPNHIAWVVWGLVIADSYSYRPSDLFLGRLSTCD